MANCLVIETATLHVHCTLLLPTPLHFGELKVEVGHSSGTIHPPVFAGGLRLPVEVRLTQKWGGQSP